MGLHFKIPNNIMWHFRDLEYPQPNTPGMVNEQCQKSFPLGSVWKIWYVCWRRRTVTFLRGLRISQTRTKYKRSTKSSYIIDEIPGNCVLRWGGAPSWIPGIYVFLAARGGMGGVGSPYSIPGTLVFGRGGVGWGRPIELRDFCFLVGVEWGGVALLKQDRKKETKKDRKQERLGKQTKRKQNKQKESKATLSM